MIRALLALPRWAFWRFAASRLSGGGSGHPSYPHARWKLWLAGAVINEYLGGGRS